MKFIVFVCGKDDFEKFKGDRLGDGTYLERTDVSSDGVDTYILVLDNKGEIRDIKENVLRVGIDAKATELLLKKYFKTLQAFLQDRFPRENKFDDVTIITHWNFNGVDEMEDHVENLRRKLAMADDLRVISHWKTFSYSSTRIGFFPARCDIFNNSGSVVEIPNALDCEEILRKLENQIFRINLDGTTSDSPKVLFDKVMALFNH